jgi:ABC-type cobalt transport system substrate-binding protein
MTSGEIGLFLFMSLACILWAIVSYSMGYKEGHKEGYQRGRAVGRHASAQAVSK